MVEPDSVKDIRAKSKALAILGFIIGVIVIAMCVYPFDDLSYGLVRRIC